MSRRLSALISAGWLLASAPALALAQHRFPPPDFESGHHLPTTQTPPPDNAWYATLDMAVLFVALCLASYLVLKRRSRRGVVALSVFCLVYFGFWRKGCVCPIGAIQNVTLAVFDGGYALPLVVGVFFLLPLLFALFFGRTFCAAVCPLGAIQDLVVLKPIQVPMWLEHSLSLLRYVYLAAAVLFAATGSAFVICQYDPFVGFFRLSGTTSMLVFGAILLLAGTLLARPYCRYLCPYGVVLGWLSWVARWHPRIDPQQCVQCHLCREACPVNAIETPSREQVAGQVIGPHLSGNPGIDRRRMLLLLLTLPALIAFCSWGGRQLAPVMSRMHFDVQLAERIYAEENGAVEGVTDESKAFRATGRPIAELSERVLVVRKELGTSGALLGAFLGLVFAVKLVQLARRRQTSDYDIDRPWCLACARCFKYCPHDPKNLTMLLNESSDADGDQRDQS